MKHTSIIVLVTSLVGICVLAGCSGLSFYDAMPTRADPSLPYPESEWRFTRNGAAVVDGSLATCVPDNKLGEEGCFLTKAGVTELLLGQPLGQLRFDGLNLELDSLITALALGQPQYDAQSGAFRYNFIHVSDIQIHERSTALRGAWTQGKVDNRIPTAQRQFEQDHADVFYAALLLQLSQMLHERGLIATTIHTGDAIHNGSVHELAVYNQTLQQTILADSGGKPWEGGWLLPDTSSKPRYMQVIGNHDVMTLGIHASSDEGFDREMWQIRELKDLSRALSLENLSLPEDNPLLADRDRFTEVCGVEDPSFFFHDVEPTSGVVARYVGINSAEDNPSVTASSFPLASRFPLARHRAYSSRMTPEQVCWLKAVLADAEENDRIDHIVIMSHYRDSDVVAAEEGKLSQILAEYPKTSLSLAGHLHGGKSPEFSDNAMLRLVTPSVQEFPKAMSVVTVSRRDHDAPVTVEAQLLNLDDLYTHGVLSPPNSNANFRSFPSATSKRQAARMKAWLDTLPDPGPERLRRLIHDAFVAAKEDSQRWLNDEGWEDRKAEFSSPGQ